MFEKEKEIFPIKNNSACQLKWTWSTVDIRRGVTSSCHRCKELPLTLENFDNFHNLPHKVKERKIMLDGKWPTVENGGSGHCGYCKSIEDNNGTSDRMNFLKATNLTPVELLKDNNAVVVTPKILEIYFNEKCNLSCTYCGPWYSSTWANELRKFGDMIWEDNSIIGNYKISETNPNHKTFLRKILEYIENKGNSLERLHLLGGETFYQKELDLVLNSLKKLKNKNLQLNIVSNFMVKEKTFKKYIEQIENMIKNKELGKLDLTASIDGWGPQAEYARHGLKCEHFEKLFSYVVDKKYITLNVNQTITALTVKSVPELIKKINFYRKKKPNIGHYFMKVVNRSYMDINIFGKTFWQKDFENIFNTMEQNNEKNIDAKKYMEGIYKQIPDIGVNRIEINKLKYFLDILDRRRNTNWRKVYPYLDI